MSMDDRTKRLKLRQQSMALLAKPDIFDCASARHRNECEHGGRIADAHLSRFSHVTEQVIAEVYASGARIEDVIDNWEHFLLGQVIAAVGNARTSSGEPAELCETCLRKSVENVIGRMRLATVDDVLTRAGAPPRRRRSSAGSDAVSVASRKILSLDTLDLQMYVTESYVELLRRSPASCLEQSQAHYLPLWLSFRPREGASGADGAQVPYSHTTPSTNLSRYLSVHTLPLDAESRSILQTPNAGGDSIESEVLSFEVLKRIMPFWELSTMEMNTRYRSSGPLTDFVARSALRNDAEVSVSVTRVFGWNASMKISGRDLAPLLIRKLSGLRCATGRILPRRKRGMILFAWVPDGRVEKNVRRVWNKLRDLDCLYANAPEAGRHRQLYGVSFERGITENIVLCVAVCKKESWMDLTGYYRVFGKADRLERDFIAGLASAAASATAGGDGAQSRRPDSSGSDVSDFEDAAHVANWRSPAPAAQRRPQPPNHQRPPAVARQIRTSA